MLTEASREATAKSRLEPAEPVVALVFPIAARVGIGDEDRSDVLRVLEAQLGRHAQLQGVAIFGRQRLGAEVQGQLRLWMQCRCHVQARVVAVGTLEADVLRSGVGPDAFEEHLERYPAPIADRAPAFDADVARDLAGPRQ